MAEDGYKVKLNVYDLSKGLARQLSTTFLGKAIEAIWHTGVVVYGTEYYFGGGIQKDPAGMSPYGTPMRVIDLGVTHVPQELFEQYLEDISPRYTAETYNLLNHNCNNFSNEITQFLVGTTIPDYILQLPNEVMSSPMGALIRKFLYFHRVSCSNYSISRSNMHNRTLKSMFLYKLVSGRYLKFNLLKSLTEGSREPVPMINRLEMTLRSGGVPQVPQFVPSGTPIVEAKNQTPSTPIVEAKNEKAAGNPSDNVNGTMSYKQATSSNMQGVSPSSAERSVPVTAAVELPLTTKVSNGIVNDATLEARKRVEEEITREFKVLMAAGNLRASEAAALATRKVMERYGMLNVSAMPQG